MQRFLIALSLSVAALLAFPAAVFAQVPVGAIVAVTGNAILERGGRQYRPEPDIEIASGDVFRTSADSTVQLLFRDETRIAVGPNSTFRVDDVQMRRGRDSARRFSVNVVGGSFRFLSGRSPSGVYEVTTPTATMGARGTIFDVAVNREQDTTLITFDGVVLFCGIGRCETVTAGCGTVRSSRRSGTGRFTSESSRVAALREDFPLVRSQIDLRPNFQTTTLDCGDNVVDQPGFQRVARSRTIRRQEGDSNARAERSETQSQPADPTR